MSASISASMPAVIYGAGEARRKKRKPYNTQTVRYDLLARVLERVGIMRAVQRDDEEILTLMGIDE